MNAERQIKIARGTAFVFSGFILAAPPLLIYNKMQGGESIDWQSALHFIGFMYILILPLVMLYWIYAWSLNRRKWKTALVFFILNVIWEIVTVISSPIFLPIAILVIALLLQGILGLRKLQTARSSA
jgi:hypothetical protein